MYHLDVTISISASTISHGDSARPFKRVFSLKLAFFVNLVKRTEFHFFHVFFSMVVVFGVFCFFVGELYLFHRIVFSVFFVSIEFKIVQMSLFFLRRLWCCTSNYKYYIGQEFFKVFLLCGLYLVYVLRILSFMVPNKLLFIRH